MLKKTLLFAALFLSAPLTADVLILGTPTRDTALDYAMQANNGRPFADLVIIVDPQTGKAGRFDVEFYQDWSAGNADFVLKAIDVGISPELSEDAAKFSNLYHEFDEKIASLRPDYDPYTLARQHTYRGYFNSTLQNALSALNSQINKTLQISTAPIRPDIPWSNRVVTLKNGAKVTISITNQTGQLTVVIHEVVDQTGNLVYPIPVDAIPEFTYDASNVEGLTSFLRTLNYSLPSSMPIPPSGYVAIIDCKSKDECDTSRAPQKKQQ